MSLLEIFQKVFSVKDVERKPLVEVELTADEWKQVIKWIGLAFDGGKKKMSISDKKLVMKIEVIAMEEAEFEKEEEDETD